MTLREHWRRRVAAIVVVASGVLALLLIGGGAVGAAPAPKPAAVPSSSSHPLQVTLPGLLTLSVDLPSVKLDVLGGDPTTAAAPTVAASTAAPSRAATRSATTAPVPAPARTDPVRTTPSRKKVRAGRVDARTPRRVAAVVDNDPLARPPTRKSSSAPRPITPRPAAEAFEGMLHTGLPIWALAGVVAMCGLGTVIVVRSAGRRPPKSRRSS